MTSNFKSQQYHQVFTVQESRTDEDETNFEVVPYSSSAALSAALWEQEQQQQQQQQQQIRSSYTLHSPTSNTSPCGVTSLSSNGPIGSTTWNAYSFNDDAPIEKKRRKFCFWKKRKSKPSQQQQKEQPIIGSDSELEVYDDDGEDEETTDFFPSNGPMNRHQETSQSTRTTDEISDTEKITQPTSNEISQALDDDSLSLSSLEDILGKPDFRTVRRKGKSRSKVKDKSKSKNKKKKKSKQTSKKVEMEAEVEVEVAKEASPPVVHDETPPDEVVPVVSEKTLRSKKFSNLTKMFRTKSKSREQDQTEVNVKAEPQSIPETNIPPQPTHNDPLTMEINPDSTPMEGNDQDEMHTPALVEETFDIKPEAIILDLMDMNDNSDEEENDRYMNFEEHEWLRRSQEASNIFSQEGLTSLSILPTAPPAIIRSHNGDLSCFRSHSESEDDKFNTLLPSKYPARRAYSFDSKDHENTLKKAEQWKAARQKHMESLRYLSVDGNETFVQKTGVIFNDAFEAMKHAMAYDDGQPIIRRNSSRTTKIMSNRNEDESIATYPSRSEMKYHTIYEVDTSMLTSDNVSFFDEEHDQNLNEGKEQIINENRGNQNDDISVDMDKILISRYQVMEDDDDKKEEEKEEFVSTHGPLTLFIEEGVEDVELAIDTIPQSVGGDQENQDEEEDTDKTSSPKS